MGKGGPEDFPQGKGPGLGTYAQNCEKSYLFT